jgi:hypothetical protein
MIMKECTMKRLALGSAALAVLSAIAFSASSAQAGPYGRHGVTASERAAIARSQARLNAIKRHAWADGRVTLWERARINAAQASHKARVARYRHN